jgi:glycolate oxidase
MAANFMTLQEMVKLARGALTRGDWDYLVGAAETETSMKRNRLAIDRLALKARVLNDVTEARVARSLLGVPLRIPVLLAPIGSLQVFERGGGQSAAEGAGRFGVMQVLSSVCTPEFEALAQACPDVPKIHQLYALGDEAWMMDIIERTQAAGYTAFCLTVDTQVYSRRERDILKRYVPQSGRRVENASVARGGFGTQAAMSWDLVKRIKDRFTIPLVLKGIACAEDAEIAVQHGVDVVYVSNHGGRQLDQGRGTFDMLPEVVRAVAGRTKVVVDGGIMRGTDILKALALGADAVGIGRLEALAMAAGGADGVVRMLELLEQEMRINLALMGLSSIEQLTPASVLPAEPVAPPHVLSAFPLLDEY